MAWDVLVTALAAGCLFAVTLALYGSDSWRRPFADRSLRWWEEQSALVRPNRPLATPTLEHSIGRRDTSARPAMEQIRGGVQQFVEVGVPGEEDAGTGPLSVGAAKLRVV